jgi:prepilin-type processing-associated H-X9-DG protein
MVAITDSTAEGNSDALTMPYLGTWQLDPGRVHGGGTNVLFCDGHVTWYRREDLEIKQFSPKEYPRVRIWNYDHGVNYRPE